MAGREASSVHTENHFLAVSSILSHAFGSQVSWVSLVPTPQPCSASLTVSEPCWISLSVLHLCHWCRHKPTDHTEERNEEIILGGLLSKSPKIHLQEAMPFKMAQICKFVFLPSYTATFHRQATRWPCVVLPRFFPGSLLLSTADGGGCH